MVSEKKSAKTHLNRLLFVDRYQLHKPTIMHTHYVAMYSRQAYSRNVLGAISPYTVPGKARHTVICP